MELDLVLGDRRQRLPSISTWTRRFASGWGM